MKMRTPTGAILESDDTDIINAWLRNGCEEIKPPKKETKKAKKSQFIRGDRNGTYDLFAV